MTADKNTSFLLRLPAKMKELLENRAKAENQSLNGYLNSVLEAELNTKNQTETLEQRQFMGQKIPASKIDLKNGLVEIAGIYYRYLIEGNQPAEKRDYIVLEVTGNIVTLRPLV
ncbi:Arc family DNA-binding protein [Ligilactobacillus equi]|uniref:Arc-like DNA binding domain-containing protein n=1 Tax=Ligilactobacillus equi DPC 6820 TaxID=1392007 RepID=V7HTD7_9LACO|nr:Arc family DNA-binding protein [Ligilactobacillus equi]ETA73177.1 hypothetical protein LEQ_2182 [Ligilactobacillus equi DPC 6820]